MNDSRNDIKQLPKDWKKIKLGQYVISVKGKKPKRLSAIQTNKFSIPYVNIKAFEKKIIEEYTDGEGCVTCDEGDFLMVWDGSRSGYVGRGIKGALGSTLVKLSFPDIEDKYAYYFLQSKFLDINTRAKGVGIPHVDPNILWNYDLLIPPKTTQQAIVSKIEELFSELDKGIESLHNARQQLKSYRQSVLNTLVTRKNCLTIESVIEKLDQGWSPKCENRPSKDKSEWGVIKTSAVQHGYFLEFENKKLPPKLIPRKQHELQKGDILITRAGPRVRVGVCCMIRNIRPKLINCDKVYRIKVNEKKMSPEYFELLLNTPQYQAQIERMKSGISDSGLNLTQKAFLQILIPVPAITEQKKLVMEIESRLSVADKMEESIDQSLQQAETLRQSILKQAFEGRLVKSVDVASSIKASKIKQVEKKTKASVINIQPIEFPNKKLGITETDLHAGVIAMIIEAHQATPKHLGKLNQVKCEKIADQVERNIGISLGRNAVKDAAGPDDYPHLKKVEHRASRAGFFKTKKLQVGHTYEPMQGLQKIIGKTKEVLTTDELAAVDKLIKTFLPFELEHAELVATIYAGWNNLLIVGANPTDEEIVYESRENWSKRKLTIDRTKFFKTLEWMKAHGYIPHGKGKLVSMPIKKAKSLKK